MSEPNNDPKPEGEGGDDTEKKFWDSFDARIDAGIERAIKKYRVTAQQRNGRSTLPGAFADLMFGKQTADK